MAMNNNNNSLLLSDTLVPDLFIYHHMMSLTKEAISVYLYIASSGKCKFSEAECTDISLLDKETTKIAIAELIASGLIARDKDGDFTLVDLKKAEVDQYCASVVARGGADISGLELSPMQEERNNLCDSISKSIYAGKMGYVFYRIVDTCLFTYGFETFVIYSLFDMAKEKKIHYDYKKVEKMASDWHKNGIKDSESLNRVLENEARIQEIIKTIGKLTRRRVDGVDIEKITNWVALGFSKELIELAYRSNKYRDFVKTKDVDDTLTKWLEAGIKTAEEAMKFEEEQHAENKRKYKKNKGKDSNYRTGAEAGITIEDTVAIEEDTDPKSDDSAMNDILNMFGDDDDEDN
ncbi:MAG: DnaD domain protein [Clostridia bacterium]|nr:DnaD domain protein [Clostridia bacterium]